MQNKMKNLTKKDLVSDKAWDNVPSLPPLQSHL